MAKMSRRALKKSIFLTTEIHISYYLSLVYYSIGNITCKRYNGKRIVDVNCSADSSLEKRGVSIFFYASARQVQVVHFYASLSVQSEQNQNKHNAD